MVNEISTRPISNALVLVTSLTLSETSPAPTSPFAYRSSTAFPSELVIAVPELGLIAPKVVAAETKICCRAWVLPERVIVAPIIPGLSLVILSVTVQTSKFFRALSQEATPLQS